MVGQGKRRNTFLFREPDKFSRRQSAVRKNRMAVQIAFLVHMSIFYNDSAFTAESFSLCGNGKNMPDQASIVEMRSVISSRTSSSAATVSSEVKIVVLFSVAHLRISAPSL